MELTRLWIYSKGESNKSLVLFGYLLKMDKSQVKSIPITKGSKKINPKSLFGIWSKKPRTIEAIRETAWGKKPGNK